MAELRSLRRTARSDLRPREALLLDNAQGTTLWVERGSLWVTQERDSRDIILGEGMRFTIDRPGRTLVAAESASAVRLFSPLSRRERMARALSRSAALLLAAWAGRSVRRPVPHG
jgi:Protein of unknown function (DUF2917)